MAVAWYRITIVPNHRTTDTPARITKYDSVGKVRTHDAYAALRSLETAAARDIPATDDATGEEYLTAVDAMCEAIDSLAYLSEERADDRFLLAKYFLSEASVTVRGDIESRFKQYEADCKIRFGIVDTAAEAR